MERVPKKQIKQGFIERIKGMETFTFDDAMRLAIINDKTMMFHILNELKKEGLIKPNFPNGYIVCS